MATQVTEMAKTWRMFPIPRGQKEPRLKQWQVLATADPQQRKKWAAENPGCNWALATGATSGVFVVDVDNEAAHKTLKKMGVLPPTRTVKTANGWHYYFRFPSWDLRNTTSKLGKKIDIRGEGGYVIVPPSVHPSGAIYKMLHDMPVADAPKWLLKKLQDHAPATPHSPSETASIPQGQRNSDLASLAGTMQRKGISPEAIEAALLKENDLRCDPPLPEKEVRAIVRSIGRYEPAEEADTDGLLIYGNDPIDKRVTTIDKILRDMTDEQLYVMPLSRRFVHVTETRKANVAADDAVRHDPRALVIVDVSPLYLRDVVSRSGKVKKYGRKGELTWADPSREDAETFLKRVETEPSRVQQRRLRVVSTTPLLLPSGEILTQPGYHEPSESLIVTRGIEFHDPLPKKRDLNTKQCRELLEKFIHPIFCEFPFAKEDEKQKWHETPSFAVVLSAIMSVIARNLLPTVPGYGFDAPTQGSGKTLLATAISVAMTSVTPSAVTYDSADEFRKILPPLLEQGARVVLVDNVTTVVENDKLSTALTQEGSISHRPLHTSTAHPVENFSVLLFTGNNLRFSGDMLRRCLKARLHPDVERPENAPHSFHPVERALQMFPEAVMAVLRVMQSHQLASFPGRQQLNGKWEVGSFQEWNRRVRWALLEMGYSDPIITQDDIRESDPHLAANEELVVMIREVIHDRECSVREIKERLHPADLPRFMELTNHKPNEPFSELKVGQCFGRLRDRWFGGFRIVWGRQTDGKRKWIAEMKEDKEMHRDKKEEEPL